MRIDNSNGDVKRVDLGKARATTGSTMGPDKGVGSYQLLCDSTNVAAQSEFHCVRLDRVSGEDWHWHYCARDRLGVECGNKS